MGSKKKETCATIQNLTLCQEKNSDDGQRSPAHCQGRNLIEMPTGKRAIVSGCSCSTWKDTVYNTVNGKTCHAKLEVQFRMP
jgi:hypothetical protein